MSADVDEAREALLEALTGNRDAPVLERLAAFETAVRADERRRMAEQGYGPLTKAAATGRAK